MAAVPSASAATVAMAILCMTVPFLWARRMAGLGGQPVSRYQTIGWDDRREGSRRNRKHRVGGEARAGSGSIRRDAPITASLCRLWLVARDETLRVHRVEEVAIGLGL